VTGKIEGKKCPIFEYSGALIKSHQTYMQLAEHVAKALGIDLVMDGVLDE